MVARKIECRVQPAALEFGQFGASLELDLRAREQFTLGLLAAQQICEVVLQLAAPFAGALHRLAELQDFDLLAMELLLASLQLAAQLVELLLYARRSTVGLDNPPVCLLGREALAGLTEVSSAA